MMYYIILFQNNDVVDLLSYDDDAARDEVYAQMENRLPYDSIIQEYRVTRIQKLDLVKL